MPITDLCEAAGIEKRKPARSLAALADVAQLNLGHTDRCDAAVFHKWRRGSQSIRLDRICRKCGRRTSTLIAAAAAWAAVQKQLHAQQKQLEIALDSAIKAERGLLVTDDWQIVRFGPREKPVGTRADRPTT